MRVDDGEGGVIPDDMLAALAVRRWGEDMALMRARASAEVDASAEAARGRWITTGAGQAMEYLLTEQEARAYEAGEEGPFPLLEAELDARGGTVLTLSDVAAEVLVLAGAWRMAAAEIKRRRRAAKLAIEAADTPAKVARAADVAWPAPN